MSKILRVMILFAGLSMVLVLAGFTNSDDDGYPLPPRPTAVPPVQTVSSLGGEKIQLHLENDVDDIPSDLWTMIEWQDPNHGDWYAVDGWRGMLDTPTTQEWWVGSDMFGEGPFRWQLYESKGGELLATSESFMLPTSEDLMVIVNVTLE